MEKTHIIKTPEGDITLSTGKLAHLAAGAVMVTKGGTSIFATAAVDKNAVQQDFFPLTVEYLERYYATGTLSGSRFNKREGFPSDDATIKSRQVDHSLRPLFPKAFTKPVNVILTLMSDDGVNNPEELLVLSASAALIISGIPFAGPASSVVIGVRESGELVVNPKMGDHDFAGEFPVSGVTGRILNIEGWAKELSDETMDHVLDLALERIAALNAEQSKFAEGIAKPMIAFSEDRIAPEIIEQIKTEKAAIKKALFVNDKAERDDATAQLQDELVAKYATAETGFSESDVKEAIDYVSKLILRDAVLAGGERVSGRTIDQIRPLAAEVDILPEVHGSALFTRGYTQSLSVVTLGSTRKSEGFDDMEDMSTVEPFMHHYNFPPYSTGEAGRIRYKPGRREVGHGIIGQNGLKHMIPAQTEFPYTVRVVSEIVTSNGSTSMAATCAASMALMAAGVPMKAAVGGIGVGLVTSDEEQKDYKLMIDIEGVEDFYGDMDFKVTGTRKGLTAIQFETKLQGVRPEILKEAFRISNAGRQQVLDVMDSAIAESRKNLAPTAPRVEVMQVSTDRIGEIIGPGGKVIKGLIAAAQEIAKGVVDIDINDNGQVNITAFNKEQMDFVRKSIDLIISGPELNAVYSGPVKNTTEFGAFVELAPGVEGLVHISEIAKERVEKVEDYLKSGQIVKVKVIDLSRPGRIGLSIKRLDSESE